MLMVVFGAGASYDSIPASYLAAHQLQGHSSIRPPLANEIVAARASFNSALDAFDWAKPLVGLLRATEEYAKEAFNIENELQKRQELAEKDDTGRLQQQLLAFRYYLRRIIFDCTEAWMASAGGTTNYAALLEQIEEWRVTQDDPVLLVTFNYDELIEKALQQTFGRSIQDIEDYIKGPYPLVKMHGSVQWGRSVTNMEVREPRDLIIRASELQRSEEIRVTPIGDGSAYPAIAIPTESKQDFECPNEHIDVLDQLLQGVTEILTIGWRAQEQTFLTYLKMHLANTVQVKAVNASEEGSEATWRALSNAGIQLGNVGSDDKGFSAFVGSRGIEDLLHL